MAIVRNYVAPQAPRQIFSVEDAVSQLTDFSQNYRSLFDFIEGGGLNNLGYDAKTIAVWRRNIRPGVIWVGGRPSEIDFFRMLMGGTPKETEATDLTIEYNSAVDYNIYAATDVTGSYGTVTGCTWGNQVNASYTGYSATFTIAAGSYADSGTLSNINLGDQLYNFNDSRTVTVIKVDKSTPYQHLVTVSAFDNNYIPQIYGGAPMLPAHVQYTSGYSDINTQVMHTPWETLGYFKVVAPFMVERHWTTPIDLMRSYKDVLQFPIIFDTNTGAEISSWDFKAMEEGRKDVILGENMAFFTGEGLTNQSLLGANDANQYTNKYTGFEGFLSSLLYGGGNVDEYNNTYGWDIDIDFEKIIMQNDALKLSEEMLLMNSLSFQASMERRAQDAFKNNSGTCTFNTFRRVDKDDAGIVRLGVQSYYWLGHTLHIKMVGAWSDSRLMGNGYIKDLGIMIPGTGLTDSMGNSVNPVEYWLPKGQTESSTWIENWRDGRDGSLQDSSFYGSIWHQIMMSVNGVENMYALIPKFL